MCPLICVQHLTLYNLLWAAWLAAAALRLSVNLNRETLPAASSFLLRHTAQFSNVISKFGAVDFYSKQNKTPLPKSPLVLFGL